MRIATIPEQVLDQVTARADSRPAGARLDAAEAIVTTLRAHGLVPNARTSVRARARMRRAEAIAETLRLHGVDAATARHMDDAGRQAADALTDPTWPATDLSLGETWGLVVGCLEAAS